MYILETVCASDCKGCLVERKVKRDYEEEPECYEYEVGVHPSDGFRNWTDCNSENKFMDGFKLTDCSGNL